MSEPTIRLRTMTVVAFVTVVLACALSLIGYVKARDAQDKADQALRQAKEASAGNEFVLDKLVRLERLLGLAK